MANLGDARTTTEAEVIARPSAGGSDGIYFGRFYEPGIVNGHHDPKRDRVGAEIPYKGERHVLVFGPNGSGKGTRFLMPNLLTGLKSKSVIVVDPKGELAAVTAKARREMGHRVVILNPFHVLGLESAGFNPLAWLDPTSPNFFDDASAIGEALIKIEGSDPHWSESAQGLIVALVMWAKLRHREEANLEHVRTMLTEANEWVKRRNEDGELEPHQVAGLRVTAAQMVACGGFEIESLASRFTSESRELASIQSAGDTQTRWLLSPPMREDLKKDGIDFRSLKDTPTTVYVVLPAERLRTHSVWLRLVVVSALRSLYRSGGLRTVMLIDEMAALGHLAPLEDAFGLVRGYRVQIAAIFQDLSQLQALYKQRWETFVANAGVVFGFPPNDLTTSEWMSKRSGQTTVNVTGFSETTGTTSGAQYSTSTGSSATVQKVGRPLFLPHELIGFQEGMGLLWMEGLAHSTRFFAPPYWKIKSCNEKASPNPYFQPEE
jgi:type IV secretion system protein VirD4